MKISAVLSFAALLCCSSSSVVDGAFVTSSCPSTTTTTSFSRSARGPSHVVKPIGHNMVVDPSSAFEASTNLLISTIDSDIANIPENEFTTVFAGGIAVMLGGVLSALIVGAILESRDSYASIVADSYAQGAEDEEFWKSLSDEEKTKMEGLLQKVRDSKKGSEGTVPANANALVEDTTVAATSSSSSIEVPKKEEKELDMFSDY
mmetsp:Transcript_20367/g.24473  ORF Transcript_20367/g.24473 Transcript_20367/m.24473 type:complete len:205 (+) Transcript_20367:160-774(+)